MLRRVWSCPVWFASVSLLVVTGASADTPKEIKARCIDANTQSQSLRRSGNFSGARAALKICIDNRCPKIVRNDCVQRLDELDRSQPTVVFDAKDPAGADLSSVKVTVDGRPWAEKLDGTALPIDAGEHSFTFEVPGQPPVTRQLVLEEGEKGRREHVVIGVPKPPPPSVLLSTPVLPPSPEPARSGSNIGRPVGLVVGGLGIAGIAAGTVFGLMAKAAKERQIGECPSSDNCNQGGAHEAALADHDLAVKYGVFSEVGFIGGGVLLAGGAALFLLSRPGASVSPTTGLIVVPTMGPTGGNLAVTGSF